MVQPCLLIWRYTRISLAHSTKITNNWESWPTTSMLRASFCRTWDKGYLGGRWVRNRDGGIVGEATLDFVKQVPPRFRYLGHQWHRLWWLTVDFDYHEVRVKQAIIENSRSIFLAVDHTKFGRNAMVKLGNISQAHMVFTNKQQPPEEILNILKDSQYH